MRGAWKKYLVVLLPMAVVVAAPMILRDDESAKISKSELRLDVITPHNELIRREFGEAFSRYYEETHGKSVYLNWRVPGGTSEIKRVLDNAFSSAAKNGKEGIGLDLFFGGGVYDFNQQAKKGRFQKLAIFETHPELFASGVISKTQSGETYYGDDLDWIGVCLSSFGICYNVDSLKRLNLEAPKSWDDLGEPGFVNGLALADPTKSGSVAKAFEMLVQQKIHDSLEQGLLQEEACQKGWVKGLNLIQQVAANARYFTDKSSKVLCRDFVLLLELVQPDCLSR